jgi:hypothetical protein
MSDESATFSKEWVAFFIQEPRKQLSERTRSVVESMEPGPPLHG